jgi:hypothetical protein
VGDYVCVGGAGVVRVCGAEKKEVPGELGVGFKVDPTRFFMQQKIVRQSKKQTKIPPQTTKTSLPLFPTLL